MLHSSVLTTKCTFVTKKHKIYMVSYAKVILWRLFAAEDQEGRRKGNKDSHISCKYIKHCILLYILMVLVYTRRPTNLRCRKCPISRLCKPISSRFPNTNKFKLYLNPNCFKIWNGKILLISLLDIQQNVWAVQGTQEKSKRVIFLISFPDLKCFKGALILSNHLKQL